jgi:4-phytase/acid phosphatase
MLRRIALPVLVLASCGVAPGQAQARTKNPEQLEYVVVLTRHGVRAPGGKLSSYGRYSALPWPTWDVPPDYLTPHGYQLMKLFGAYDRAWLAQEGLFGASGCVDAAGVSIVADSDQRTRETGKALAEGMFPGCGIRVQALPEGTHDPLFHAMAAGAARSNPALETAAIAGRMGGDAGNLTLAYRAQLEELEKVLNGCGHAPEGAHPPVSLFDVPATLQAGTPRHPVELSGPLMTASTVTENFLLEYTNGMPAADVGWGCVDGQELRSLMQLHSAAEDMKGRTFAVARIDSANLLQHILAALEQHATGEPARGAPGKRGDRLLILSGHDTNIANVAGALRLDWILDGRRDDTPPGGALVFELWRSRDTGALSVRIEYTAQTLEQMRAAEALTLATPPDRVPVFVPGCSREDMTCSWQGFAATVRQALQR